MNTVWAQVPLATKDRASRRGIWTRNPANTSTQRRLTKNAVASRCSTYRVFPYLPAIVVAGKPQSIISKTASIPV